jgi:DNA-binding transcriptional LysR family regulator
VAFLPKVVAHFRRAHPYVEVVLLEEPGQSAQPLEEWLRTQTIDVALLQLPSAGIETTTLMRDELRAIVPASSPLGRRRQLSIRDRANEPLVMSRYTSEQLRAAYARHRLTPRVRFEVQDLGTLINMVREGLGFSIVPRIAFPAPLPGVTVVPVTPRIHRELGLAIRDQDHAAPALRAFVRPTEEIAAKTRRK